MSDHDAIDATRRALSSLDAFHAAEPKALTPEGRSLHRLLKVRRALYYSVLAPFGAVSRLGRWVVPLTTAMAAAAFAFSLAEPDVPAWVLVVLFYWVAGGMLYFAISLQMAGALDRAAASAGVDSDEVLRSWAKNRES